MYSEIKVNVFKYGISPLLGVNYFISPHLSVGTELKINVLEYSGKADESYTENNGYDLVAGTAEIKIKGINAYFGPLGYLSVNIYF